MNTHIQTSGQNMAPGQAGGLGTSAPFEAAPPTPEAVARVLRNTYALLSLTLLFSAGTAAIALALKLPAPGIVITLGGYFGLLFAVHKLQNSGWAIPVVFALTGFMGYTLGPMLAKVLSLPAGGQVVMMALAATGATFLALSAWVLTTKRDFSFMGGFLFVGMVIAVLAGLGAMFFQIPALGLAVSAMVALLSAGLILFETSRIVNGGEGNYVLATVGLTSRSSICSAACSACLASAARLNDPDQKELDMKCPCCPDTPLSMMDRQGVEIDFCPACRGIWLDRGELDKLLELAAPTFHAASRDADTLNSGRYNGDRRNGNRPREDRYANGHDHGKKSWLNDIFD